MKPPSDSTRQPRTAKILYLIDGHSYLYRAYYAIRHLSTASGMPTNAVYGMATMLLKIIREHRPDYLAIAFDTKAPTLRHEAYADYKAHRPPMPDDLSVQLPVLNRLIDALRIAQFAREGYEADDLIATVARLATLRGIAVVIVSSDKDLYQLVGPSISLYDSLKDRFIGPAEVVARFGVEPGQIADLLSLMGDSVDNVPGVPGIGEKTAAALIAKFGSVEALFANIDRVEKPKIREALRQHAKQARLSLELVRLYADCPIPVDLEEFRLHPPDPEPLRALLKELEFTRLLNTLSTESPEPNPKTDARAADEPALRPETDLTGLWTALAAARIVAVAIHSADHEPRGTRAERRKSAPATATQVPRGLCLYVDRSTFYIPWGEGVETLCAQLQAKKVVVAGHDLKLLLHALADLGAAPITPGFDTQLAAYLLDPLRTRYDLSQIANGFGITLGYDEQPSPDSPSSCATASRAVAGLVPRLRDELHEQGLHELFETVEMPLIEVLVAMERHGVLLDTGQLGTLGEELRAHLARLEEQIYRLAGTTFNLNSPKQLADVLFDKLGLPPTKKTKTGYSTDESVLTQLALQHELPAELISYRQLTKLLTTYVDALPELVNPLTGRLHTTFHQTVTATGRLSSSQPNLQNIPVRGEWGPRIRACFIAGPGCRLLSADYNQIELRLLAHMAQDPMLLEAFRSGVDVHAATASQLFDLPKEQITPQMRRAGKTVNFSVIYGMSPYGLSRALGITQGDAKRYIDRYFTHYSGVKQFIDRTITQAARDGVVTTLWHRRRPIPELTQRSAAIRSLGERTAVNTVVQGSAADIIKMAMNRVYRTLQNEHRRSTLLLQIHDELVLEVPEEECDAVSALVRQEMEGAADLSVPMTVDLGIGHHWAEVH